MVVRQAAVSECDPPRGRASFSQGGGVNISPLLGRPPGRRGFVGSRLLGGRGNTLQVALRVEPHPAPLAPVVAVIVTTDDAHVAHRRRDHQQVQPLSGSPRRGASRPAPCAGGWPGARRRSCLILAWTDVHVEILPLEPGKWGGSTIPCRDVPPNRGEIESSKKRPKTSWTSRNGCCTICRAVARAPNFLVGHAGRCPRRRRCCKGDTGERRTRADSAGAAGVVADPTFSALARSLRRAVADPHLSWARAPARDAADAATCHRSASRSCLAVRLIVAVSAAASVRQVLMAA
jgi:hypothetical protein